MKVKQLIEALQKLDPEIECLAKADGGGYNTVTEVKGVSVLPFKTHGTSYYGFDYIHDLAGYIAYEIITRHTTK